MRASDLLPLSVARTIQLGMRPVDGSRAILLYGHIQGIRVNGQVRVAAGGQVKVSIPQ